MEQIIDQLKDKVGGDLMAKLGLDRSQAEGAVNEAGSSVQQVVSKNSSDPSALMDLFSKGENGAAAQDLGSQVEQDYLAKLTGKLGLDSGMAAQVKDMVLPALMQLLQNKGGGDLLGSLLGGKGGGMAGMAGKIGGLGKMFGK